MKVEHTIRHALTAGKSYSVRSPCGRSNFVKPASTASPKIYVVSFKREVLYVGMTEQRIATRFYGAFNAKGETGYYGYKWAKDESELDLDIWILSFEENEDVRHQLETIEAEVVFCVRTRGGQWPRCQNEIHFHPSEETHRSLANRIYDFAVAETPTLPASTD